MKTQFCVFYFLFVIFSVSLEKESSNTVVNTVTWSRGWWASVLLAVESLRGVDAVAVDWEGEGGKEALGCGEDVGGGHLREARPGDGAAERARHIEPMHVVIQHLHGRLGVDGKAGAVDVHEVHGVRVGCQQVGALHGQRDVGWGVANGARGVDAGGGRRGTGGRDAVHQRQDHVAGLQPLQGLQVAAVEQTGSAYGPCDDITVACVSMATAEPPQLLDPPAVVSAAGPAPPLGGPPAHCVSIHKDRGRHHPGGPLPRAL